MMIFRHIFFLCLTRTICAIPGRYIKLTSQAVLFSFKLIITITIIKNKSEHPSTFPYIVQYSSTQTNVNLTLS